MFDPRPDSQGRAQQLVLGFLSVLVLFWALTSAAHAGTIKVTHIHSAPASRPAIKEDRVMGNMALDIIAEGTDALVFAFGEHRQANGWCVDCDQYGYVGHYRWPAFVAVEPRWIEHGK